MSLRLKPLCHLSRLLTYFQDRRILSQRLAPEAHPPLEEMSLRLKPLCHLSVYKRTIYCYTL